MLLVFDNNVRDINMKYAADYMKYAVQGWIAQIRMWQTNQTSTSTKDTLGAWMLPEW